MSSRRPPKALAPTNTSVNPMRPVLASGKESAAKAMRCTTLSLPSGAGGVASRGKHRDRQNEGDGEGDWDVEVRAHRLRLLLATMKGNK